MKILIISLVIILFIVIISLYMDSLYLQLTSMLNVEPPEIPKKVSTSNNAFTIKLSKKMVYDQNMLFSTTSMYTAFSMLYEGVDSQQKEELKKVFGFNSNMDIRHDDIYNTISSINHNKLHKLVNFWWIAKNLEPVELYDNIMHKVYRADLDIADLTNKDDGIKKINALVSNNTNNKINNMIDYVIEKKFDSDYGHMVITNIIYSKGIWTTPFPQNDTKESEFWNNSERKVKAEFMNIKGEFDYTHSNGSQVLKIPYKGDRISMLVILPDKIDGMTTLEDTISPKQIEQWIDNLKNQQIDIAIPKFEMNSTYELVPNLRYQFPCVFSNCMVLSDTQTYGITNQRNQIIQDVIQKTYVKINEKGIETIAATNIESIGPISATGIYPNFKMTEADTLGDLQNFTANHPFIFLIYDDSSNTILFMGKVVDPSLTKKIVKLSKTQHY